MKEYTLRPMTMADADKMLEWKNDPQTRRFAIATHDMIEKEDHYHWLPNNLQYFSVIHDGETAVGAIRMQDQEISIWIDQVFRNQGIAKSVLKLISGPGMTAKIVEGNLGSMRAFIFAGFVPTEYIMMASTNNYYIFRK